MNCLSYYNIYKPLFTKMPLLLPLLLKLYLYYFIFKASLIRLQSNVPNYVGTGFVLSSFVVRLITTLENHNKNIYNRFIDPSFNNLTFVTKSCQQNPQWWRQSAFAALVLSEQILIALSAIAQTPGSVASVHTEKASHGNMKHKTNIGENVTFDFDFD